MGGIVTGLVGSTTQQKQRQTALGARMPLERQRMLFDILNRNLLGPMTTLPDIPISVPLQQAISGLQDVMQPMLNRAFGPQGQQGLAARLAGGAAPAPTRQLAPAQPTAAAAPSGIPAGPGVPVFGRTQTREELGLPHRREYFPFTPTPEELEDIGIAPVRGSKHARQLRKRIEKLEGREERIQARIERREGKGKGTVKAERRLGRVQQRLQRQRTRQ